MFVNKTQVTWLLRAIFVTLLLTLAACKHGDVRPSDKTAALQGQYDMIIVAFKNGQFMVNGGVLTSPDLVSHIAYLESQGQMPKTVLLKDGDESFIRAVHLRDFASLQATYGFEAFVETDDGIKPLQATDDD